MAKPVPPTERLVQRFQAKYVIRDNGCWEWQGAKDGKGYGQIRIDRKNRIATHIALELAGKPRKPELPCALHRCDNPSCVNPDHLWWGTMKENTQDSIAKGRANSTGLLIGHALSRANKRPLPRVNCEACGTEYETSRWQYEKNKHHFCSTDCCWAWQSTNFTNRPRSSWAA